MKSHRERPNKNRKDRRGYTCIHAAAACSMSTDHTLGYSEGSSSWKDSSLYYEIHLLTLELLHSIRKLLELSRVACSSKLHWVSQFQRPHQSGFQCSTSPGIASSLQTLQLQLACQLCRWKQSSQGPVFKIKKGSGFHLLTRNRKQKSKQNKEIGICSKWKNKIKPEKNFQLNRDEIFT